jgi:hypothetical protein
MIYAVSALVAGIPNILMVTHEDDRFLVVLATSILVVSRYVGYIKLAGFALLDPSRIKENAGRIATELWVIVLVLVVNGGIFLRRFGIEDFSIAVISIACIGSAGVLVSHLMASRESEITRSALMRMVSGVLIVLGAADVCITRVVLIPQIIGLVTLFFGIYTERKSLGLAIRQTLAIAGSTAGAAVALRVWLDPAVLSDTAIQPNMAIGIALVMLIIGMGYYLYSRRGYTAETSGK